MTTKLEAAAQQALEALKDFARFQQMMMDGPDVSDRLLAEDYAEAGFMKMATAIPALRAAIEQTPCNPAEDGVCEALECCKQQLEDARTEAVALRATEQNLIAALEAEREECAKVCDIEASVNVVNAPEAYQEGRSMGAAACAAAIRARSNT